MTLTAHFLSQAGGSVHGSVERAPDLESTLQALFHVGQSAWRGITVAPETFVCHLAERIPREGDPLQTLREIHAADLYLACACSAGNGKALEAFDKHVIAPVVGELDRGRALSSYTDEIKQALRMRLLLGGKTLLPKIGSYRGQGPLTAWVRMAAARIAADLRRAQIKHHPLDTQVPLMIRSPELDPELAYVKSRYAEELEAAFRSTLTALTTRERTVLRLYFLDGLDSTSMAATFGVSSRTVQRWIARAREQILDQTRLLLCQRLRIPTVRLDSLIGLLHSQIDMSICKLLNDHDS